MKSDDQPTHKTYKFSTFQELVDTVPADRIRLCLEEIGTALSTAKATTELVAMVAADMAGKADFELPARVITLPEFFEWVDDGKGEIESRLHHPDGDGEVLAVRVTKGASEDPRD